MHTLMLVKFIEDRNIYKTCEFIISCMSKNYILDVSICSFALFKHAICSNMIDLLLLLMAYFEYASSITYSKEEYQIQQKCLLDELCEFVDDNNDDKIYKIINNYNRSLRPIHIMDLPILSIPLWYLRDNTTVEHTIEHIIEECDRRNEILFNDDIYEPLIINRIE